VGVELMPFIDFILDSVGVLRVWIPQGYREQNDLPENWKIMIAGDCAEGMKHAIFTI